MYRPRGFACITALAAGLASAALASSAPSVAMSSAAPTAPATSAAKTSAPPSAAKASAPPRIVVTPDAIRLPGKPRRAPLSTAQCEETEGIACYQPDQIRAAYQLPALYARGITGAGETIVIVDSFGSPTIRSDLATFDKKFGYPAPPKFSIIAPAGKVPAFDPNNGNMVSWAEETTLDVEYAHALAPGASILLVGDADLRERGHQRLPADRDGRGVRDRSRARRGDQPVVQRHRGDVRQLRPDQAAARRLPRRRQPPRDRAGRLGRRGRDRLHGERVRLLHPPGDLLAGQRPARDRSRRHPAAASPAARTPRSPGTTPTTRPRTSTGAARPTPARWPAAAAPPSTSPGRPTRTASRPSPAPAAACPTSR